MKKFFAAGLVGLLAFAGLAYAQVSVPLRPQLSQNDLVQVIPNGQPSAQSVYAKVGQIGGVQGYQNLGTITTGNTFQVNNGVSNVFAQAAGTLAAVTLTTPTLPSDGQHICWAMNQITTLLTISATTGQTVNSGTAAALPLGALACWTYVATSTTWFRSS